MPPPFKMVWLSLWVHVYVMYIQVCTVCKNHPRCIFYVSLLLVPGCVCWPVCSIWDCTDCSVCVFKKSCPVFRLARLAISQWLPHLIHTSISHRCCPSPSKKYKTLIHTHTRLPGLIPTLILWFNDLRQWNYPITVALRVAVSCVFTLPSCWW